MNRTCVVTYHKISRGDLAYTYHVTQAAFEEHLSIFACSEKSGTGARPLLTFDDGDRSNYEYAFPSLEKFGMKATFFILAGRTNVDEGYLSWAQARELISAGHSVGSHGWSHRMLTRCGPTELTQELNDSRREIEDRLGVRIESVSAPGGRWNERVIEQCERAGYRYFFHSNPWVACEQRGSLRLEGRHMVTNRISTDELQRRLAARRAARFYHRVKYGVKEQVRSLVGDHRYHKIWCSFTNWGPGQGMELSVDVERPARKSRFQ